LSVIDYMLLAIVLMSAVISIFRGFVKEALSLLSWVAAIWAASRFGVQFGDLIAGSLDSVALRAWLGRGALLIAVLFSLLMDSTGLSGTDRAVGMVFGLARGTILAAVVVLLLEFAGFTESSWWTESKLIPYVAQVAEFVKDAAQDGIEYLDVDQDEVIDTAAKKAGEMLTP
jgi:membrane protein required for colicin V production